MANKLKKKNPILLAFAKQVRQRRYELGLTQEELAEKSNFHVNYIGGIERAERNVSIITLITLAKALEIEPSEILPC